MSYLFTFSHWSWGSQGKNTAFFLPFPSPVDHILSDLSTMTHPSWVALHAMAHSFTELDKTQKTKTMVSTPITSWQIDGETMETVTDFIFLGSKLTADGDCSHQIKRCLLLGRKAITKLDSTLKSRDVTLPTKVHLIKAMVFQWSCMDVRVGL